MSFLTSFSCFSEDLSNHGSKQFSQKKLVKTNGSDFNELACLMQRFCQQCSQELIVISFMIQTTCSCNGSLCLFSLAVLLKCPSHS